MTRSVHTIFEDIRDTLSRIQPVLDLVEVSLPVIQHYPYIKYNEFTSLSTPEPISADTEKNYDTIEFVPSEILNYKFHDAYYYFTILPDYFLLSYSNQSEINRE